METFLLKVIFILKRLILCQENVYKGSGQLEFTLSQGTTLVVPNEP